MSYITCDTWTKLCGVFGDDEADLYVDEADSMSYL